MDDSDVMKSSKLRTPSLIDDYLSDIERSSNGISGKEDSNTGVSDTETNPHPPTINKCTPIHPPSPSYMTPEEKRALEQLKATIKPEEMCIRDRL